MANNIAKYMTKLHVCKKSSQNNKGKLLIQQVNFSFHEGPRTVFSEYVDYHEFMTKQKIISISDLIGVWLPAIQYL